MDDNPATLYFIYLFFLANLDFVVVVEEVGVLHRDRVFKMTIISSASGQKSEP